MTDGMSDEIVGSTPKKRKRADQVLLSARFHFVAYYDCATKPKAVSSALVFAF
jgi:hypothetical protein